MGLSSGGGVTVLSTITGTPWLCAMSEMASMSAMLPAGLPIVSANTAMVLLSMSRSRLAGLSSSANRTSMPCFGSMWANRVYVPPYSNGTDTTLLPASAMVRIE